MQFSKRDVIARAAILLVFISITAEKSVVFGAEAITLERCLIMEKDKAQVPAREAGVIQTLEIKEGDLVKQGQ
jgi:multidrug efflux pump subunit AcrA (membrane-fusion protein)